MKIRLTLFTFILLIALHATIHAQQTVPFAGDRIVTVMTQNLYSGVDQEIFAVPTATSPFDLASKVLDVYNGYFARNFPARAERIAAEVAAARPELIGLQEAILVRTQTPPDGPATPATTVALDFVQILRSALAAKGLRYDVAAESPGFDAELPSFLFDVRHTEREVILARSDVKTADLKLSNTRIGNFAVNCQIPGPLGSSAITLTRGWASVEAKIRLVAIGPRGRGRKAETAAPVNPRAVGAFVLRGYNAATCKRLTLGFYASTDSKWMWSRVNSGKPAFG